ncbi:MAG: DUF177 domain-containing protein [Magnetococcales bacterium]|nr:DUF177 domain-containing protein [Magnetococcales bacterium]
MLDTLVLQLDPKGGREKTVHGFFSRDSLPLIRENLAPDHLVQVCVTMIRGRERWRVRGALDYRIELQCSRCLDAFQEECHNDIDREFRIGPDPFVARKNREMEDDLTCLEHGALNVVDLVQEEIVLALPMMPLCSDRCRGLCPHCGGNRNHVSCTCETRTREGSFACLQQMNLSRDDHHDA